MRNYIILNNKSSNDINGLIIQELAPISKPQQRTQVETIDGRDGDIVTPLGYAAYNKKIKIGLYGDFDINEIIAYFATQGTAIFSNEPDKYYNYQIVDQIDYERLVRYRVATVTMHVQPFKYSATEGTITVDASDTVSGEGSDIALDGTAEAPFTTLRHKGNATQTAYSGKNLFGGLTEYYVSYCTYTLADNILTITPDDTTHNPGVGFLLGAPIPSGTTVHLSSATTVATSTQLRDSSNTVVANFGGGIDTTRTLSGTADRIVFNYLSTGSTTPFTVDLSTLQIEAGSSSSAYEPYVGGIPSPNPDYPQDISVLTGDSTIAIDDGGDNSQEYVIPFGNTYLAAIDDYADEPVKVGDTWYIRRKIGRVVLDGTQTISSSGTSNLYFVRSQVLGVTYIVGGLSDYFAYNDGNITDNTTADNIMGDNQIAFRKGTETARDRLYIKSSKFANNTEFKTWLSTHPTTVYYVLATPTDEEITDQDLIDALDELYDQAHAYKGHTHITATAEDGNAPAVLAVEVNENNESTVTNAGNTTSRPIITIYGQGNIGMYINDVQVLDIALGDEQYITIDSVAMEAYKDTTENLKNRLVTGDYNKLALNAGANKIYFTGNVTKYEISKYSRWL